MAHVKTAFSVPEPLFREAETIAKQLSISRSRLYALALEEFLKRFENRQILAQINAAWEDGPGESDAELYQVRKASHRHLVEGEW